MRITPPIAVPMPSSVQRRETLPEEIQKERVSQIIERQQAVNEYKYWKALVSRIDVYA